MTHHESDRVWLIEQEAWGRVVKRGAYVSLVNYSEGGIEFNVYIENDNFIERSTEE